MDILCEMGGFTVMGEFVNDAGVRKREAQEAGKEEG